MVPTLVATAVAVGVVAGLLALAGARSGPEAPPPSLRVGGREGVPATRLALLGGDGRSASLRQFLGKPLVVAFFASWCPACEEDLSVLAGALRAGEDRGVRVVGVDVRDTEASAKAALARAGARLPVLFDPSGRLAVAYHLLGLPSAVFLDARGDELGSLTGPLSRQVLGRWLARLGAVGPAKGS